MLGGGGVQGEGLGANANADVGHVLLRLMSGGCGFGVNLRRFVKKTCNY